MFIRKSRFCSQKNLNSLRHTHAHKNSLDLGFFIHFFLELFKADNELYKLQVINKIGLLLNKNICFYQKIWKKRKLFPIAQ